MVLTLKRTWDGVSGAEPSIRANLQWNSTAHTITATLVLLNHGKREREKKQYMLTYSSLELTEHTTLLSIIKKNFTANQNQIYNRVSRLDCQYDLCSWVCWRKRSALPLPGPILVYHRHGNPLNGDRHFWVTNHIIPQESNPPLRRMHCLGQVHSVRETNEIMKAWSAGFDSTCVVSQDPLQCLQQWEFPMTDRLWVENPEVVQLLCPGGAFVTLKECVCAHTHVTGR